jgi:glutamine cyclotransferase
MNASSDKEDEEVVFYLKHYAELGDYYLHKFNSTDTCLINYFDKEGQGWSLMEDDDAFVERCVDFLRRNNAPEFDDVEEMKAFELEKSATIKKLDDLFLNP